MEIKTFKIYQIYIAFLIALKVQCQEITMLTPYVLAKQGESAVLIARSSATISSNLVNWYYNGNALTINGAVSQGSGKYIVSSNGTIFTLSINSVKSSDYGFYSLIYLNIQTIQITVVNATLSELTETIAIPQCKNPNSTVAICIILLIGYLMLLVAGATLFLLNRADNPGKKTDIFSIMVFVFVLQVATVFISAMVTLWGAFYRALDNRNTTASIFGLIAHLIGWFPIFFFSAYHAKQNKYQLFLGYALVILTTIQVATLIGVILCISHCTSNITLPLIDVDYGMLGVLFSVLSLVISCVVMLFTICYYKSNVFKQLIITLIQIEKPKDSEDMNGDVASIAKSDSPTIENQDNINETMKDKSTKKKSLKSKLKNKIKSLKGNKIQNENGINKQAKGGRVKTAAVNGKSDSAQKHSSPIPQPLPPTAGPTPVNVPVVNSISPIPQTGNVNDLPPTERTNSILPNMTTNSQNNDE